MGKVTNLKMETPSDKPLVVMFSWLMAKKKNVYKYADIYNKQGFDVLNVSISPWQVLWPVKGSQVVALDVLKFLEKNSYNDLVLHGFSVGAYLWSESMVIMLTEMDRYQKILNRVRGQIWDSAVDVTEISVGVPVSVFPRNQVLQNTLKHYMLYHLKTFDKVATRHYYRASQVFHTNIVKAPALFLLSKTDAIGSLTANLRVKENWEQMGIPITFKCWDKSPHVGHLRIHPKEYVDEINMFLKSISSTVSQEKQQEKMRLQN